MDLLVERDGCKTMVKARIFISCGQNDEELQIADKVQKLLQEDGGFDVYVARKEHILSCLTENIFRKLEKAEYFIFIDFKREKLIRIDDGKIQEKNEFRGSLFTNQELAIATFLGEDIEVLGFQEEGVISQDGIIQYTQINPIKFRDRATLPNLVVEEVWKNEWKNNWRKELEISFQNDFETVGYVGQQRIPSNWYHLRIKNLNKRKVAKNCVGFIEKIRHIESGEIRKPTQVELKWKGIMSQSIYIAPEDERLLDAFWYPLQNNIIFLGYNPILVDFTEIPNQYKLTTLGTYDIDYVIYSDNFSPVKSRLRVHKTRNYNHYRFEQIPMEDT